MVVARSSLGISSTKGSGAKASRGKSSGKATSKNTWASKLPNATHRKAQEALRAQEAAAAARAASNDLWLRSEPVLLKGADGKARAVTLANDSELGFADVYRVLLQDPVTLKVLDDEFKPQTVAAWTKELNLSEKQFRQFGLRKGVDRLKNEYKATELGPASFELALTHGDSYAYTAADQSSLAGRVNLLLPELVGPILKRKGYPVSVVAEVAGGTEVKHASFETSPRAFADYIRSFHRDFERANTHLHIGLPASAISKDQGLAIAHSLETRTVLALAAADDDAGNPIAINGGSPLAGMKSKGTVVWDPDRFKTPVLMHDIELRQWNSIEHGMGLIHSAMELAQNASKLRTFEGRTFGKRLDPYLGNISGALEHAGVTLAASKDPARQKVGRELLNLAQRSRAEQEKEPKHAISQPLRTEITKYLSKNDVESLLDTQAFLTP